MCAVLLTVASAVLTGCVTTEGGQQFNIISTQQEIELGQKMAKQLEGEERLLDDAVIQAYVSDIGRRLARNSPRADVSYQFKVIDEDDTVNAFAMPGGYMYVYTGLLRICDNEAQLASVMGHEIAHVASYHYGERATRVIGYQLIANIISSGSSATSAQLAAKYLPVFTELTFSRAQEREADRMGMDLLFRAGYKPESMVDFMQKLLEHERESGAPRRLAFMSSHPATANRVADLQVLMEQYPVSLRNQNQTYADRYRTNVLNRLK
jgi:predicted Zn-dependent protease